MARATALKICDGETLMKEPRINPYIMVFIAVIAVSFSSLFVKLSQAHPFITAFYRLFITFAILLPFSMKTKIHDLKNLKLKHGVMAALSGVFLASHFITWFISLKYTSVASSVVLVTTQPIFVVLGSYLLFREKIRTKALLGGAIALFGSFLIGASDFQYGGTALLGDFLALVGAVAVSGYLIIGRILRAKIGLGVYTFITYGSASAILGIVAIVSGQAFYPYSMRQWLLFAALAVVCTILGHTVFNWALRYVQASVIAIGVLGEPVGAIVWASLFLGENPSVHQLVSAAVILLGLFIFTRASSSQNSST